jgi:signal transduction histidine kinase
MTQTAAIAPRPIRRPLLVPAQAALGGQAALQHALAEPDRHRLARDLHDGAIQEVLAAGLAIDFCLADLPAGSALRPELERAKQLTATAVRRLRSSLQDLRDGPAGADEDLTKMLQRLTSSQRARQLEVSVTVTGVPAPVAPATRRALFQVASECVFNAALHGGARRVIIRLSYGREAIALCVADDGRGKPETLMKVLRREIPGAGGGYHVGLSDIAARAEEMGWTLRADRSDLGGIAVSVLAPRAAASAVPGVCGG